MTIHLPPDLERFVYDQVLVGRYPSEDDVIRDALEQLRRHAPPLTPSLGSIGAMHDDAELLEQVTQDITLQRPEIRLETRRFLGRRPEFLAVCRVVVTLWKAAALGR